MQCQGNTIKFKIDYSENFTKIKAIVNCDCGKKIIIDEVISDSTIDFENEKANAEAHNAELNKEII